MSIAKQVIIVLVVIILGSVVEFVHLHKNKVVTPVPDLSGSAVTVQPPQASDVDLTLLFNLINQDRAQAGVASLKLNSNLNASANFKCNDMVTKNYYAHQDPSGNSWTAILQKYVPYYYGADENIDVNTYVVRASDINTIFMNSTPHRTAILNPNYTDAGVADCAGQYQDKPAVYIVEHFASPAPPPNPTLQTPTIGNPNPNNLPPCPSAGMGVPGETYSPGLDCF